MPLRDDLARCSRRYHLLHPSGAHLSTNHLRTVELPRAELASWLRQAAHHDAPAWLDAALRERSWLAARGQLHLASCRDLRAAHELVADCFTAAAVGLALCPCTAALHSVTAGWFTSLTALRRAAHLAHVQALGLLRPRPGVLRELVDEMWELAASPHPATLPLLAALRREASSLLPTALELDASALGVARVVRTLENPSYLHRLAWAGGIPLACDGAAEAVLLPLDLLRERARGTDLPWAALTGEVGDALLADRARTALCLAECDPAPPALAWISAWESAGDACA